MDLAHRDWKSMTTELNAQGWAVLPQLLPPAVCAELADTFEHDQYFRSRVVMQRHGFGRGEYKYFRYPLPPVIQQLRSQIYAQLALIANEWNNRLGINQQFPDTHEAFLEQCHRAGQCGSTPLLLKYCAGDYNCLHQDVYGEQLFPLQTAVLLSAPGRDFTGGEFILTQQRPRMQTRASVAPLAQGDALVFAVRQRPVQGGRSEYRVSQRHGVSKVLSGRRYTLGVIFHDAKE